MSAGRTVLILGLMIAMAGAVLWGAERLGLRLGRLPGDIVIERGNTQVYVPLTTCLLGSAVLSWLAWVMRKFQ